MELILSARDITENDIPNILDYWFDASEAYLRGMGADIHLMYAREDFRTALLTQLSLPYKDKKGYATIWTRNGTAIGHCNVNNIHFGEWANMHLHLWSSSNRQKGMGQQLIKSSLSLFFKNLQLQKVICEPYALNPATNKFLEKVGFTFVKTYVTVPGSINFEQEVNQWIISREKVMTW